jgi:hypothetical protein
MFGCFKRLVLVIPSVAMATIILHSIQFLEQLPKVTTKENSCTALMTLA